MTCMCWLRISNQRAEPTKRGRRELATHQRDFTARQIDNIDWCKWRTTRLRFLVWRTGACLWSLWSASSIGHDDGLDWIVQIMKTFNQFNKKGFHFDLRVFEISPWVSAVFGQRKKIRWIWISNFPGFNFWPGYRLIFDEGFFGKDLGLVMDFEFGDSGFFGVSEFLVVISVITMLGIWLRSLLWMFWQYCSGTGVGFDLYYLNNLDCGL